MYLSVKRKVNLYRRFSYLKKAGVIFVHVPKAAGTSISHAMYGRTLGHYSAEEYRRHFPKLYETSFVFSFVRNPWSRALSAYRFVKAGRTETMGVHKPQQYHIPEFENFHDFIVNWLPHQNLGKADYIFKKQSDFLVDKNRDVIVDFVGKVENISTDFKILQDRLRFDMPLSRLNATGPDDYVKHYLNKEMVDVVGDIYAEDVQVFGYSF